MKRVLVIVTLAGGLIAATASGADAPTRAVTMPGKLFDPAKVDVLVGTTVTWRNDDSTNHTVTTDDDVLASGYIPPGGAFSFTFAREGRYAYHCTIHRFMRGEIDVFGLVLAGPEEPLVVGQRVVLAGLAPPGTSSVALRGGETDVVVRPKPDGSFAARLLVRGPAVYRAVAGQLSSPPVRILAKPVVRLARSVDAIRVSASPARHGASALLQAYDRERFDWVTVARGRLDDESSARFALIARAGRVRVLVKGAAGWADAASGTLTLGS